MKLLLLDVGNSRLKWALLRQRYRRGRKFAATGVVELPALHRSAAAWSQLFKATGTPDAIYVCNVAGAAMERQIRAASKRAGLGTPHFMRTVARTAGVRNAYPEPWRLGVDRWLGLIGARHEHPGKDLCLVGLGTAMTIDLLARNGQHFGGIIVPGPRLMIESLLEHTAGIRRRAGRKGFSGTPSGSRAMFARDTHGALIAGARHACAALIEHGIRQARLQLGRRPRLILAGGAADAITPLINGRYWRTDDLVLRGLAVVATDAQAPDRIKSARA
jgi:type III pantothenate kinase